MAITIKDVAREAGVSITTVSKIINGTPTISQATTEKVQAIMDRLEYIPNKRAANFSRAATKNIVFLATLAKGQVFMNPHMFEMICGIQNELSVHGYTLTLVDTSRETNDGELARKIILEKSADGIIVFGESINKSTADFITNKGFPHIVIGKPEFTHRVCWIDFNNVLSGETAAQHLIQCGYKRIAFIGGKKDQGISLYRLQGAQLYLQEHGADIIEKDIYYIDYDVRESYNAALSLLKQNTRPDAIICESSLIAVGVMKALDENDIVVPTDMGVIMIDDHPYSKAIFPSPTVVNIDIYDLGVQAAKSLLRKIKDPALQMQIYTTLPELIKRETTRKIESM